MCAGIGVFSDRDAADAVNSDPQFADFNDKVAPLLASPSERVELQLLHQYVEAAGQSSGRPSRNEAIAASAPASLS